MPSTTPHAREVDGNPVKSRKVSLNHVCIIRSNTALLVGRNYSRQTFAARRVHRDQIDVRKITDDIESLVIFFKYKTDNKTTALSLASVKERSKLQSMHSITSNDLLTKRVNYPIESTDINTVPPKIKDVDISAHTLSPTVHASHVYGRHILLTRQI